MDHQYRQAPLDIDDARLLGILKAAYHTRMAPGPGLLLNGD